MRYDQEKLEELFAPDMFEYGRSGQAYTRSELMKGEMADIPAVLPLPNFKARLIGEDVAQVTYLSIVHYGSGEERARRSSIWSRTPEGWRMRFHQGTAIPEEMWDMM